MWSCQIAMQVSKLLLPLSFCAQLTVDWWQECRLALVHGAPTEYVAPGNCFDVHFTLPEKSTSSPLPLSPTCCSGPLGSSHHLCHLVPQGPRSIISNSSPSPLYCISALLWILSSFPSDFPVSLTEVRWGCSPLICPPRRPSPFTLMQKLLGFWGSAVQLPDSLLLSVWAITCLSNSTSLP